MDHYCPWIGTTVGLYNQANFIRFLFFVPIGCTWAIYIIFKVSYYQIYTPGHVLYRIYRPYYIAYTNKALLFNFIGFGGALGTTLAVSFLFYQQVKILLSNKTSIERWICEKAEDRQNTVQDLDLTDEETKQIINKASEKPFIYPYDLGKLENIKQVLGWHGFKNKPCCSGFLDWPVLNNEKVGGHKCGQFDLTVEQLSQKALKKALTRKGKVVQNFSGWWLPIFSFGFKTGCFKIPISDENRLPLCKETSGQILVTRGYGQHWWYGQLVDERGRKRKETRGWFPRRCVELERITEKDVEESRKDR